MVFKGREHSFSLSKIGSYLSGNRDETQKEKTHLKCLEIQRIQRL